jgi:hypothetical protein
MSQPVHRIDYQGVAARIEKRTGIRVATRTLERWDDLGRTGIVVNKRKWFTPDAVDQATDHRIRMAEAKAGLGCAPRTEGAETTVEA